MEWKLLYYNGEQIFGGHSSVAPVCLSHTNRGGVMGADGYELWSKLLEIQIFEIVPVQCQFAADSLPISQSLEH